MRIMVLPGMGATAKMYHGAWREWEHAEFLDWPAYGGEQTLGEVAQRVIAAADVRAIDGIVGSSMGGMVALEIAARVGSPWVGLVGSAKDATEINRFLRLTAPLATMTPVRLAQVLAGSASGEFGALVREADPAWIKAMCRATAAWRGPAFDGVILRVHGERDRVIPCPAEADDVVRIPKAGHLVAMTHPAECVDALKKLLRALGP